MRRRDPFPDVVEPPLVGELEIRWGPGGERAVADHQQAERLDEAGAQSVRVPRLATGGRRGWAARDRRSERGIAGRQVTQEIRGVLVGEVEERGSLPAETRVDGGQLVQAVTG